MAAINSNTRHVFISYSHANETFVERLVTDLHRAGIVIWRDTTGLKPGTRNWEQAIRDALRHAYAMVLVASPDSRQSLYVQSEIDIAIMYERPIYPIWAAGSEWADSIPIGMTRTQYIDARGSRYRRVISEFVQILSDKTIEYQSGLAEQLSQPGFIPRNPYKGLLPFGEEDGIDFFGRETFITEILKSFPRQNDVGRLCAIVGSSGSGKSSLVMGGILPRLKQGALDGSSDWIYLGPIVPGTTPIENLALALKRIISRSSLKVIHEDLKDSVRGFHMLAKMVMKKPGQRVIVVIDQFEELFGQSIGEDERREFINLLVTAVMEPQGPVTVILTLRADYYDRPLHYPVLGKLIHSHSRSLLPMSLSELRDVIVKPSTQPDVDLVFEEGLVGDLLFEVQGHIGALPLLEFVLYQLFEQRHGRLLTVEAYQNLGGVGGAVSKHAEIAYASLSAEHRQLVPVVFLRLVDLGETEHDIRRRRALLTELETKHATETSRIQEIVDVFVRARLLVTTTTTVEISHEALIREWKRLGNWLREKRNDIFIQQRLSNDVREWIHNNRRVDELYRGARLADIQAWAKHNRPSIVEEEFIAASELEESQQQSRLAKLMSAKDLFISGISHELRVPITSIKLYQALISRNPENSASYMSKMERELNRLERLIDGLLVFSKLGEESKAPSFSNIEPNEFIKQQIDKYQQKAVDRGILLSLDLQPGLPNIGADPNLLQSVLNILLDNALLYTPPKGSVRLETIRKSLNNMIWIGISVSDTGPGITADEQPQVFERFFRGRVAKESGIPGVGLGLAIAKEIVRRHGGDLEFYSSGVPGEGAKFTMWLPEGQ